MMRHAKLDFIAPLFVPADRPERLVKAAASGADAIIIDLEDAVAEGAKEAARRQLQTGFTDLPVLVRINQVDSPWFAEDLLAVAKLPLAAVILPKADTQSVKLLASASHHPIVALIESASGLANAREVVAMAKVERLMFGTIDFCEDIGCGHSREALLAARSEIILASRLAGKLAPVDGVTTAIDDYAQILSDSRYSRELGFAGKLCIHPKQVNAIFDGFLPDDEEIAWAESIMKSGDGAVAVDGMMVDAPVRKKAAAILSLTSRYPKRQMTGR